MSDPPEPTAWQKLSSCSLPVATIRQVDRIAIEQYHMHSLVLMENAAAACAQWMIAARASNQRSSPRVVLLCGRGNNGGDGLAIMRHLQLAQWDCTAVLLGPLDRLTTDAFANWQILAADTQTRNHLLIVDPNSSMHAESNTTSSTTSDAAGNVPATGDTVREALNRADIIIDAMLGTGAGGEPREPLANWIEWANEVPTAWRVAIDIPTGLNAEAGTVATRCFRADATLTFVARKPGFAASEAQAVLGQVTVLPIGIPQALVEALLRTTECPMNP